MRFPKFLNIVAVQFDRIKSNKVVVFIYAAFMTTVSVFSYIAGMQHPSNSDLQNNQNEILAILKNLSDYDLITRGYASSKNSKVQEIIFQQVCNRNSGSDACIESKRGLYAIQTADKDDPTVSSATKCDIAARRPSSSGHQKPGNDKELSDDSSYNKIFRYQIDVVDAVENCNNAINEYPSEPRFKYQLARAYHANRDYENAAKFYRQAADQLHGDSFRQLGFLHSGGKLLDKDSGINKAYKIFKEGSDLGLLEPTIAQAFYIQYGYGVDANRVKALELYTNAANQGSALAASRLGDFYRYGFGPTGKPAPYNALKYYRLAASLGDSDGQIDTVDLYVSGYLGGVTKQNKHELLKLLSNAKDGGNPRAYYYLGWLYQYGRIVEQDNETALKFYNEALDRNFAYSAIKIGEAFEYGFLGKKKNPIKALDFYGHAARLGERDGFQYEANALLNGSFTPRTEQTDIQARKLTEKAIQMGGGNWPRRTLAWLKIYDRGFSNQTKKDKSDARAELRHLLEVRNDSYSGVILGKIYRDGIDVPKDIELAKEYFQKAAELGGMEGNRLNAALLYYGIAEPISVPSLERAFKIVKEGADQDHSNSLNTLGWMFEHGIGVLENDNEAKSYYERAFKLGHSTASSNLGKQYRNGYVDQKPSPKEALRYFRIAINWGDFSAYAEIAGMLYERELFINDEGEISSEKPDNLLDPERTRHSEENTAFNMLMKGYEWAPKNTTLLNDIAWAYENGRGVKKSLSSALKYRKLASDNGHNYSRRWLATHYLEDETGNVSWPKALSYLSEAASDGDVLSLGALLAVSTRIADFDSNVRINVSQPNCEVAQEQYPKLLKNLGKQRNILSVNDTIHTAILPVDFNDDPQFFAACGLFGPASILPNQFDTMLKKFKSHKFERNIFALRELADSVLLVDQTGSVSDAKSWLLKSLRSEIFIDDIRARCLLNQLKIKPEYLELSDYIQHQKIFGKALFKYCPVLEKLNQKFHFDDYVLGPEEIKALHFVIQNQGSFSSQDYRYALSISVSIKREALADNQVDLLYEWYPVSSKYAVPLAKITAENAEEDSVLNWAGVIIGWNMIFGNEGAGSFLYENRLDKRSSQFWRGVHSVFVEVCAMPESINWDDAKSVDELFSQGLHDADHLGMLARTRDYHSDIKGIQLAIPAKEEWWEKECQ